MNERAELTKPGRRGRAADRLGARLALARAALLWERLWPSLWPAIGIIGLFALFAIFDIGPALPGWLHAGLLAAFAIGLAVAVWRGLAVLRLPDDRAAGRRLEQASALAHRPVTTRDDWMEVGRSDDGAVALWEAHRRQRTASLARLRVGLPKAGLAARDPWGLRVALVLLLVIGVAAARGDIGLRFGRALLPDFAADAASVPIAYDIWITPPAYTHVAPMLLSTNSDPATQPQELRVPEASTLIAQLSGGSGEPILAVGDIDAAFDAVDGGIWRLETQILTGDRLMLTQDGEEVAAWPLTILPDLPPKIGFAQPPNRSERHALRIDYEATDDYGVASVSVRIVRADGLTGPGDIAEIAYELPMPAMGELDIAGFGFNDLTAHPWAGLPVGITLEATDAAGQRGTSETVTMDLPERPFRHPVARAIVEQRRRLIAEGDMVMPEVADKLRRLSARPELYDFDAVVTLALTTASARLILSESDPRTVPEVVALLWDTALRVEEGEVALVEQRLRELQRELQEALANNAPEEEIQRLMDELRSTLDEFLEALADRIQRDFEEGFEQSPLDEEAMEMTREDLQELIDQAEELSQSGAREAARNLLAELQEILENLRADPMLAQPQDGSNEAMELLADMEALIRDQQGLLDRTFRKSQEPSPDGEPSDLGAEAGEQEGLRMDLGEIMRELAEMIGDIPENLGNAEQEMRGSHGALIEGDATSSADAQVRALDELQQGARQMRSQLRDQLARRPGGGPTDMMRGENEDPFGRDEGANGMIDTSDIAIPEEADLQRSREILDELRRRSSDRTRPEMELDYIERLLRRF
ncbi:MAG: TIGR02302 family protein [Dongiaceae bacterium]